MLKISIAISSLTSSKIDQSGMACKVSEQDAIKSDRNSAIIRIPVRTGLRVPSYYCFGTTS